MCCMLSLCLQCQHPLWAPTLSLPLPPPLPLCLRPITLSNKEIHLGIIWLIEIKTLSDRERQRKIDDFFIHWLIASRVGPGWWCGGKSRQRSKQKVFRGQGEKEGLHRHRKQQSATRKKKGSVASWTPLLGWGVARYWHGSTVRVTPMWPDEPTGDLETCPCWQGEKPWGGCHMREQTATEHTFWDEEKEKWEDSRDQEIASITKKGLHPDCSSSPTL